MTSSSGRIFAFALFAIMRTELVLVSI